MAQAVIYNPQALCYTSADMNVHFALNMIEHRDNVKKVGSENHRSHAVVTMQLLHCELASPSP